MRIRAYAKINWALNIVGRRANGYHEMDMLMQSISLCDTLDMQPLDELSLSSDQPGLAGPDNLILRAANALNARASTRHGATIHLTKRIPARAGLGGGSADCAAALVGLNQMWGLNLPMDELMRIGLTLGADVPFCLTGGAARVRGIGEQIEPVPAGDPVPLLILHPGGGLSTPEMFRAWDEEQQHDTPADIDACIQALASNDLHLMGRSARNMLASAASRAMKEIDAAQSDLKCSGAAFAQMSGSGSAVFGAFLSPEAARFAQSKLQHSAILCKTK